MDRPFFHHTAYRGRGIQGVFDFLGDLAIMLAFGVLGAVVLLYTAYGILAVILWVRG